MAEQQNHTQSLKSDERFMLGLGRLMNDPDFRYFSRSMLSALGVRSTTYTGNALSGTFAQGMQNAGLMFEDLISTAAFELFLKMLQEHNDEELANRAAARRRG